MLSVNLSVLDFVIFQKDFKRIHLKSSNTTKLILLDALLLDVTQPEIQIATDLMQNQACIA